MSASDIEAPARSGTDKGLSKGAVGLLGSVVIGVSCIAPAYTLSAALGPTAAEVGTSLPAIFLVGFIPMLLVAFGYQQLNRAMPDSGTTFTWGSKAFGPWLGWMGGWGLLAATILVLSNLAGVAVDFLYLALAQITGNDAIAELPHVLMMIVTEAFTPTAAVGGFAGATVAQAIQIGVSRGVLSNEAGLGSSPIAHGIANVKHPVEQGTVGVFEVWVDTIVVCTATAFVILESGLWTDVAFQGASGDLTEAALSTTVPFASAIVALCSFLFAFSTLIGWCYYGEKCFEFMFGSSMVKTYRGIFVALIMVGSVVSVPLVWAVGTLLNGFMALPNLIGLAFLSGTVAKLAKDYFSGKNEYAVTDR